MSTYCKYYKQKKQVSYDGGYTWYDVSPAEYQKGELYAQYSRDCGYEDETNYFTIYPINGDISVEIYIKKDSSVQYTDTETYTYQYKINDGEWIEETAGVKAGTGVGGGISLNSGDILKIRAIEWSYPYPGNASKHIQIQKTSDDSHYYGVSGDVYTLTTSYFDQMGGQKIESLAYLFDGEDLLRDTNNFDITDIVDNLSGCTCMFRNCTRLTNVPSYSSSTIGDVAFMKMYSNCRSLTTIPSRYLSATTIGHNCYNHMFEGCSGLTSSPQLPATTLSASCYYGMFSGCTSLSVAPDLPSTSLANSCYAYMFDGCSSLTTAPSILPATTLSNLCYEYMFHDCTSLATAPELPATTLVSGCYNRMFYDCSNLKTIKCFATNISATDCTASWVYGVPNTSSNHGTFYKNSLMSDWTTGINGIPSYWVVENVAPEAQYRTTSGSPYCNGYDKYIDVYSQVSYDGGSTWSTTAITPTLIESGSTDCTSKVILTYSGGSAYTVACDSSTVLTSGDTRHPEYLYDNVTAVTIGDCVEEIGAYAFLNYTGITSITIPSGITTISKEAFGYCRGLTNVNIPSGVTSIGQYAFRHCSGLQSVTVNRTTPPTLGTSVFTDTNNCIIYVPAASVSAYKSASNWSTWSSRIQAIP